MSTNRYCWPIMDSSDMFCSMFLFYYSLYAAVWCWCPIQCNFSSPVQKINTAICWMVISINTSLIQDDLHLIVLNELVRVCPLYRQLYAMTAHWQLLLFLSLTLEAMALCTQCRTLHSTLIQFELTGKWQHAKSNCKCGICWNGRGSFITTPAAAGVSVQSKQLHASIWFLARTRRFQRKKGWIR